MAYYIKEMQVFQKKKKNTFPATFLLNIYSGRRHEIKLHYNTLENYSVRMFACKWHIKTEYVLEKI